MKKLLHVLMALVLTGAAGSAYGQEEGRLYEMEEVTITGSKVPKTPGNVTQKIEIISAAEFDDLVLANGNLAEILSYSPGNFANVLSRNDANWGSSGGLAHTYKGYMLDGLPIDAFIDLQSLDPWAFERIEDQRGSASVLYPTYLAMDFAGNQSPLAGTANFILRERIVEQRTRVSTSFGSYNTLGGRLYHQQAAGNFHWFAGAHYEDSDYTNYGTKDSWLNMVDDPGYEKTKLYARGTYFIDGAVDHRISFYAHRTWHVGDAGRPNRGFDHEYTTLNAHYVRPIQKGLIGQLRLGYRDYARTWEDDTYGRDWDDAVETYVEKGSLAWDKDNGMLQTILPVDLSLSYQHTGDDLLTVGTDYQVAWYETYGEAAQLLLGNDARAMLGNDARAMHFGLYVQEEQLWKKFVFRIGGRINRIQHDIDLLQGAKPGEDSQSWTKLLGSAGVRYNQSRRLSLFSNVGTSFKAPSLKSVGGTIPISEKGSDVSGHLPNPDLKPESGLSFDVGASYLAMEGLTVGVRGFLISIDDQIAQIVVPEAASQSQDINAGKTLTTGLEVEVRHSPAGWLQWHANYTFTKAEVDDNLDPDKDGADMNFVPQNVINLGARFALPGDLTASANVQLFSSMKQSISNANPGELDGYELVTARIEKRFADRDGREIRAYLEPYNLLNNDFEMAWGFKDPGFSATGGLTVSF
jgi:iron complex outermembrane recepter protein